MNNIIIKQDGTFEVAFYDAWFAKLTSVNTPEKLLACIYHFSKKNPNRVSARNLAEIISTFSEYYAFGMKDFEVHRNSDEICEKFSRPEELLSYVYLLCMKDDTTLNEIYALISSYDGKFSLAYDAMN